MFVTLDCAVCSLLVKLPWEEPCNILTKPWKKEKQLKQMKKKEKHFNVKISVKVSLITVIAVLNSSHGDNIRDLNNDTLLGNCFLKLYFIFMFTKVICCVFFLLSHILWYYWCTAKYISEPPFKRVGINNTNYCLKHSPVSSSSYVTHYYFQEFINFSLLSWLPAVKGNGNVIKMKNCLRRQFKFLKSFIQYYCEKDCDQFFLFPILKYFLHEDSNFVVKPV